MDPFGLGSDLLIFYPVLHAHRRAPTFGYTVREYQTFAVFAVEAHRVISRSPCCF
jgi:hypothetical protein